MRPGHSQHVEGSRQGSRRSEDPSRRGRCSSRRSLSKRTIELIAERLALVSKGTRIALLQELKDGEAGVQELADRLAITHQNASHHLSRLWQAGILERRSEGTTTIYAITDWSAWWVVEQIAQTVCEEG